MYSLNKKYFRNNIERSNKLVTILALFFLIINTVDANSQLIKEKYQGIRPAPGYPACPDHTEKKTLWSLLEPDKNIGLSLTESYAMYPTAAVSGWYFAHPESRYFGIGKIKSDQVEDYAKRKGISLSECEQWLSPVLAYK